MTNHERPTLEVLARHAGVSRATASRVLRGASNVSDAAREAVLAASAEISYAPNLAARSLVTRRSDSIAFLVAETEDRLFGDPYFLTMLRGAQAEAASAGRQLVFAVVSSTVESAQFTRYAGGGHVDGVLLVSLHGDHELPHNLEAVNVPTVINGRPLSDDPSLHYVDSDNFSGAHAATTLLLERGARCIATITGPMDMAAGIDRLAGYEQALTDAGRAVDRALQFSGDFSLEGGAAATRQLLDRGASVDAVFAASDLTALGAMAVLAERGCRVPEDVAVVGFDDVREARLSTPGLTTIRQPIERIGRAMARKLLDRIDGHTVERTTILPVQLVRRASA